MQQGGVATAETREPPQHQQLSLHLPAKAFCNNERASKKFWKLQTLGKADTTQLVEQDSVAIVSTLLEQQRC